jgi:hypothetical protein
VWRITDFPRISNSPHTGSSAGATKPRRHRDDRPARDAEPRRTGRSSCRPGSLLRVDTRTLAPFPARSQSAGYPTSSRLIPADPAKILGEWFAQACVIRHRVCDFSDSPENRSKLARGARFTRRRGPGECHLPRLSAKIAQNSLFAISAGPSANRPTSCGNPVRTWLERLTQATPPA